MNQANTVTIEVTNHDEDGWAEWVVTRSDGWFASGTCPRLSCALACAHDAAHDALTEDSDGFDTD